MKSLVFHIGLPKTGSSAIQVFLAKNHAILEEKSVDYLRIGEFRMGEAGLISSGNGAHLARALLPAGRPDRIQEPTLRIKEFLEAIAKSTCETGIVSSELFSEADNSAFRELLCSLRQTGVVPKVLYYIRSQEQFISSVYIQQVKRHHCIEQPDAFARRIYKYIPYLRYFSHYQRMCELFGATNVICSIYEKACERASGLFLDFLSKLRISEADILFDTKDVNNSIAPNDIALMLILNRYKPRMQFSDMIVENAQKSLSVRSGEVHRLLSPAIIEEIRDYFFEENGLLASSYFHAELLFPDQATTETPTKISTNSMSQGDLIAFFGGLLIRMDDRLARLEAKLATAPTASAHGSGKPSA